MCLLFTIYFQHVPTLSQSKAYFFHCRSLASVDRVFRGVMLLFLLLFQHVLILLSIVYLSVVENPSNTLISVQEARSWRVYCFEKLFLHFAVIIFLWICEKTFIIDELKPRFSSLNEIMVTKQTISQWRTALMSLACKVMMYF